MRPAWANVSGPLRGYPKTTLGKTDIELGR
jgi:hypothetical protein